MTEQEQDVEQLIASGVVPPPARTLDEQGKVAVAVAATPVTANSVELVESEQYGGMWEVKATIEGAPVSFRLGQNEGRDSFMQGIANATAKGPVGGLKLWTKDPTKTHPFVILVPRSYEG